MPEGPSIVILKEAVQDFKGEKVLECEGNSTVLDFERIRGKKILDFKSWGKHFLICFSGFTIRVHFLLFGSYRINEKKESKPRLAMVFSNGELNLYACSVKVIEGDINDVYDWTADVMNPAWDKQAALEKIKKAGGEMVCDILLNQDIFAGVGNIIKNEVLYRIRVHPESAARDLPHNKLEEMAVEAVNYSFDFLEWKKEFTLKKHWLAHTKTVCHRCNLPIYRKVAGKTKRRTFFCTNCQVFYGRETADKK